MNTGKILIIGSGGYIACVVLPVLKKYFPVLEVTVFSRTPGNLLTLASRENINYLKTWDNMGEFDVIFLACPPADFISYLSLIKNSKANIWLEKPLIDLDKTQFDSLLKWSRSHQGKIWAGFNKRAALNSFSLKPNSNQIKIEFHVDVSSGWRDQLSLGGSLWMDGIHALDMAEMLLPASTVKVNKKTDTVWELSFKSAQGTAEVRIGNVEENRIEVNGIVNSDFTSNRKSLEFFKANFGSFLNSESKTNFSFEFLEKYLDILKP